jgi:hypothetical protein
MFPKLFLNGLFGVGHFLLVLSWGSLNAQQQSAVGPSAVGQPPATVGQEVTTPLNGVPTTTGIPTIPSIENRQPPRSSSEPPKPLSNFSLPNTAGQQWVEYDIRAYTKTVKNQERPQQALVDWILRETGTDTWFGETAGALTADKNTLRVYHTPAIQQKVAQLCERFVNGVSEPQVFGLRIIQIGNPQWRAKAFGMMRSIPSTSTGVQAWLMPKENGAILLSQLRERNDARELQAVDIPLFNGQLQALEQLRSRNYLKEYVRNPTAAYPPWTPVSSEVKEGFRLQVSPLMSLDNRTADLMLKCEIDQVERLSQVRIDLPMGAAQTQYTNIEVPQIVSWRLQERISWPTDQILMLSCGIVAAPNGSSDNSLMTNPPSFLGLNRVIPTVGSRSDALLWLEYRGPLSTQIGIGSPPATQTSSLVLSGSQTPAGGNPQGPNAPASGSVSRGRY